MFSSESIVFLDFFKSKIMIEISSSYMCFFYQRPLVAIFIIIVNCRNVQKFLDVTNPIT